MWWRPFAREAFAAGVECERVAGGNAAQGGDERLGRRPGAPEQELGHGDRARDARHSRFAQECVARLSRRAACSHPRVKERAPSRVVANEAQRSDGRIPDGRGGGCAGDERGEAFSVVDAVATLAQLDVEPARTRVGAEKPAV